MCRSRHGSCRCCFRSRLRRCWSDFERHQRFRRRAGGVRCLQGIRLSADILELAWQGFTEHWINGVGIRGWGPMVVSMESINVLPVSERWHPHLYALRSRSIPVSPAPARLFFVFWRRLIRGRGGTEFTGCRFGAVSLEQLSVLYPTSTATFSF